ncbi:MAG: glycosyltransferase [Fimbriimonadaceae bacterium]|nr:glycosyltransferase [Fimbriimonadaceae bacterium]
MTRVLRVFSRLNIGGPSLHVVHLSAGLTAHGFETKLVVGQTTEHEGDLLDFAETRGVDITVLPKFGRAIRPLDDLRVVLRICRLAREYRPDILHTHTAKAGALGRVAARLTRVPLVVHTYHGHVLSGYFNPVMSAFFRSIERGLAGGTDVLLTVSESVKHDLVRLGVGRADRIRVLPLGLDLLPLAGVLPRGRLREAAGWPPEAKLVGIVGRLVPIKDVDTFIEAAYRISSATDDVRFAVIGDGEERTRLETRAKALLRDRIHFFGWKKDTAAVFGDLDIVVNTSLNEGTPVALIEALAAGRPVVATAIGGTPDLLEGGRFGALVPAGSAERTAQAIEAVLSSPVVALQMATVGQDTVLKRYSVERLLNDMAALYREQLTQRAR